MQLNISNVKQEDQVLPQSVHDVTEVTRRGEIQAK